MFQIFSKYKEAKRLREVANTFISHGIGVFLETKSPWLRIKRWFAKESTTLPPQVRFRKALESLGPTFIKLGQILSTRADLLPEEWIKELMKLRDEVEPTPWNEMEGVIKEELGSHWRDIFLRIEPLPVGSASIAQVHEATLSTGDKVVVKILRPGIEETVETDIAVLKRIAQFLDRHFTELRIYNLPQLVDEFAFIIKREMDFRVEGANCERIRALFYDTEDIKIPKVFWNCTTKRVLVMEKVEGTKLQNWKADEETRCKVAEILIFSLFKQIMEGDVFHADPHPANILITHENRIALLDFGMVGFLDKKMQQFVRNVFLSLAKRDYDSIIAHYKRMGLVERMDERRFKLELMGLIEPYILYSLDKINIGEVVQKVIEISVRYGVKFPSEFLMLGRALLLMDGNIRGLCKSINVFEMVSRYAGKLTFKEPKIKALLEEGKNIYMEMLSVKENMMFLLSSASEATARIKDEGLRVKVLQDEIREREMKTLGNRLVLSTVSVGLFLGGLFSWGFNLGFIKGFPLLSIVLFAVSLVLLLFSLFL